MPSSGRGTLGNEQLLQVLGRGSGIRNNVFLTQHLGASGGMAGWLACRSASHRHGRDFLLRQGHTIDYDEYG